MILISCSTASCDLSSLTVLDSESVRGLILTSMLVWFGFGFFGVFFWFCFVLFFLFVPLFFKFVKEEAVIE